jgi:6-phosphofructokinase 1
MNPAIRAIVRTCTHLGLDAVGIESGYQGIFDRQFIPLSTIDVSGKIRNAGTFLGSSRCARFREDSGPGTALEILRESGIDSLIVIGGDGSLTGARCLHKMGFPVLGLPGTIDNDLAGTDMGIGVDTCLNTIITLIDMIKATAASHRRCFVVEVMGRGSGYLALMSAISTGSQAAVIPEYPFDIPAIFDVLDRRVKRRHNNSVIVVAEGVCSGQEFIQHLKKAGIEKVNQELRLTVLGHVQRGGAPTHFDRLLASRLGETAVHAIAEGRSGCMAGTLDGVIKLTSFDDILGKRKPLPPDALRLARSLDIVIGQTGDGTV